MSKRSTNVPISNGNETKKHWVLYRICLIERDPFYIAHESRFGPNRNNLFSIREIRERHQNVLVSFPKRYRNFCPSVFWHYYSVADPDPKSGAFLTPGSGIEKIPETGSWIRDEHPGSYFWELSIRFLDLQYLNSLCGSGMEKIVSGMEKFRSGIREKTSPIRNTGFNKRSPESSSMSIFYLCWR